jgi:hypothetical protein
MSVVFCCLAIGKIGDVGKMSLKSILSIPNSKILVLADLVGGEWVQKSALNTRTQESRVVVVQIPRDELEVLEELDSSVDYRPFGNPKFFRLMYLKWQILSHAISAFPNHSYVVFTDLDVFWTRSPETSLSEFITSSSSFAIQPDADSKNKRTFLCPGIMVWKTNSKAKETLESIRVHHESLLKTNPTMPDDKAINDWASKKENHLQYKVLNEKAFVIGHRLPYLLLGIRGFSFDNLIAYHANYTIGIKNKAKLLRIVDSGTKSFLVRLYYGGYLLARRLMRRLFR